MIQENKFNIEAGDRVAVRFAWREDETPTHANFKFGTVSNVFHKDLGDDVHILKFAVDGFDFPVDADKVVLIEKGNIFALPVFITLREDKCAEVLRTADKNNWHGFVTANNFDYTEFQVESSENTYTVKLRYATKINDVSASCSCPHFTRRRQLCKHASLVAMQEIYQTYEVRQAA